MDTNRCRSRVIFQVAKNRSAQDSNARNRLIRVQRDINLAKHGTVKLQHLVVELRTQESQKERRQESQQDLQQESHLQQKILENVQQEKQESQQNTEAQKNKFKQAMP